MNLRKLRKSARHPKFISGLFNYCDRWCERCSLSDRCLSHAMERAEDDGDPAARDVTNEQFWNKLQASFRETMALITEQAKAIGIDLENPNLHTEVVAQERAARRRAAKDRPLALAAMAYSRAADQWMGGASEVFAAKRAEWQTEVNLGIGHPGAEAVRLSEFTDVIRWYQHFTYVKLCRALDSQAEEDLDTSQELHPFPRDSDGSAKIALIAMDRSIAAWSGLRAALGADEADGILDLLAQLAKLRGAAEQCFPGARSFVRPGFDETEEEAVRRGQAEG